MNICFFGNGFSTNGGIGRVVSIIGNELAERYGYRVYLCSYYNVTNGKVYDTDGCIDNSALFDHPISMTSGLLKYNAVSRLSEYIKKNSIDLIIASGSVCFLLCIKAARKCGIKVFCWEHVSPTIGDDYKFQKFFRIIGTQFCDCNIILTKNAFEWYQKYFKNKRNIQIYNPIDPKIKNYIKSDYKCDSKKIISVGRLCYQKNFSRLIEIARTVLPNNPDWSWDIYGDGIERDSLQYMIFDYGLENQLFLKGQEQCLYDKYSEYSFIVMTSRYEGFPMVLLEASAFGLPMISFDIETGPNEIIVHGENGYLCNTNSDLEIIDCIQEMISSVGLRTRMSAESRKTSYRFDSGKITEQWKRLIESIE